MPDDDRPGFQVSGESMVRALAPQQAAQLFPNYNPQHFDEFVSIDQEKDKSGNLECLRERSITFHVNFATYATDNGDTAAFVKLAAGAIDLASGVTPVTVVNYIDKVITTVEESMNRKNVKGSQSFHFPVVLCCRQMAQVYNIELMISGLMLINDNKNDHDWVSWSAELEACGVNQTKEWMVTGEKLGSPSTHAFTEKLEIAFLTDGNFEVNVQLNESCHVDYGPAFVPWVALIRFQKIVIKISTSPVCKEGTIPELKTPTPAAPRPRRVS